MHICKALSPSNLVWLYIHIFCLGLGPSKEVQVTHAHPKKTLFIEFIHTFSKTIYIFQIKTSFFSSSFSQTSQNTPTTRKGSPSLAPSSVASCEFIFREARIGHLQPELLVLDLPKRNVTRSCLLGGIFGVRGTWQKALKQKKNVEKKTIWSSTFRGVLFLKTLGIEKPRKFEAFGGAFLWPTSIERLS